MMNLILSLVFLFGLVGFAHAGIVTISDDFDDPVYTNALWSPPFGGNWTHPSLNGTDLGYHGLVDSGSNGTAVFVANQQFFDSTNLLANFSFRFHSDDTSTGFLIIDRDITTGIDTYNEYGIFVSKDSGESDGLKIWYNNVTPTGETNTFLGSLDITLDFDIFYRLQLLTDSGGNITLSLFDDNLPTSLLGSLSGSSPISFGSGVVGIATSSEATFNDFFLTGNAVPIPGSMDLLALGLLGLAGISRRKN